MRLRDSRLVTMNAPVDIELIKGRQRAEDMRRLKAGEITPEALQRENSFIWSAADILYVDLKPKGTEESWARIIQNLQENMPQRYCRASCFCASVHESESNT